MADSAAGIDRSIDTAGYSPFVGSDRPAGDRPFRGGVRPAGGVDGGQPDIASLIQLGVARLEAGAEGEATEYFRKALEVGDQTLGAGNPDLMLILNDLTRLYLKQSRYADAEPLLLRLLDMKRSKGEDHPEVATVLASLAAVQQSLGRHESAEQLWRRVLEIRERTLAPNHFAIATTLEHLGDACAARGNIREALPAFQRALTIRERTLGDAHPSVRTSKERIADLQLQAADDSLDSSGVTPVLVSPDRYRLRSGDQLRLSPAVSAVREQSVAPPREVPTAAPAPAAPQMRVVLQIPAAEPDAAESMQSRTADNYSAAQAAGVVPLRDALESIRDEMERPYTRPTLVPSLSTMVDTLTRVFSNRQVAAGTAAVVVVLLSLAVAKERAWGDLEPTAGAASTIAKQPAADIPVVTASALATPVGDPIAIAASERASRGAASKVAAQNPRVEERAPSKKSEAQEKPDKKFSIPTLANSVLSHLDSVVSKAGAGSGEAAFNVQPTAIAFGSRSTLYSADASNAPTRAQLIGELPTPSVPTQGTDLEGEVRVRFTVDTQGQPIMSTFAVVTSPHPLLTAAVRKVIPAMRFEPARTGGSDSRTIPDVVGVTFRFARSTR